MKSKTIKIGLFALALCSVTFVTAQEEKQKNPEKMFAKIDANEDGSISLEEFKEKRMKDASKAEQIEKRFAKMDTNEDGVLDMAEFKAGMNKSKKGKKAKMKK
ncbi:EF-hand domain-containing protein [Lacinutrix chionoecetis]